MGFRVKAEEVKRMQSSVTIRAAMAGVSYKERRMRLATGLLALGADLIWGSSNKFGDE